MKFYWHVILSLLLLVFYPLFGINVFIAVLASVLIDVDHIPFFVKKKTLSYEKLMSPADGDKKNLWKGVLFLFHTVEFNLLLIGLGILYPVVFFVSIGFVFHILTDALHHHVLKLPVVRWLFFINFLRE